MPILTMESREVVRWHKELESAIGVSDARVLRIAECFTRFSPAESWSLGNGDSLKAMNRVREAIAGMGSPEVIFQSVEHSRLLVNDTRFRIEGHFRFGRFNSSSLQGTPFVGVVREFMARELGNNASHRAFQENLQARYGRSQRDDPRYAADSFREVINSKLRTALQGTVFGELYYLVAEAAREIAALFVGAVLSGREEDAEQLEKLLLLYAIGLPILEFFHGCLIVLEA